MHIEELEGVEVLEGVEEARTKRDSLRLLGIYGLRVMKVAG